MSTALATVAVPTPLEYAGRRALVVGLGESGLAMAQWLAFKGASLRVADSRQAPPGLDDLKQRLARVEAQAGHKTELQLKLGEFDKSLLADVDVIAWSPGLSTEIGSSADFYQAALEQGVTVIGELDLFAQALADLGQDGDYRPAVIAVTGTNGKTTTVRLVQHLCEAAGKSVIAAGNISPSLLDALFDALQAGTLPSIWALELSSFQLSICSTFAPSVATILNFSQNHLDWHSTADTYAKAKQNVFGKGLRPNHNAAAVHVKNREQPSLIAAASTAISLSFGSDVPTQVGEFGLVREGGLVWLAQGLSDDGAVMPMAPSTGRRSRKPVQQSDIVIKRLMPGDALKIRGRHNQMNALAALALCTAVGVPMAAMLHGLRSFAGEPHRCQLIAIVNDIEFYNDSKATTVAATVAALSGLDKPSVLIAGGKGKGQDFSALAQPVREHAKAVFLIGVDAPQLQQALNGTGIAVSLCASLQDAVKAAADVVRPGQVVLMSPACASLDMFTNYEARGHAFIAAVEALQ